MAPVETQDLEHVKESLNELSAHVVALTAVVAGIATSAVVDYDRLEECVNYAAKRLRPRARPILLAKAALVLEDFERIQKALQVESRKKQGLKKRAAKR